MDAHTQVAVSQPCFSGDGQDISELDFDLLVDYLFNEPGQDSRNENSLSDDDNEDSQDEDGEDTAHAPGKKRSKETSQVDRRRERNKLLARKTRQRKKFFFESLQSDVAKLTKENEMLKEIVRQKLGGDAVRNALLGSSTHVVSLATTVASSTTSALDRSDSNLMKAIQSAQRSFCVTDPRLPDNPIIFASQGFLQLTGYGVHEVVGRNCRFLQGPDTDQNEVRKLREGISAGQDTAVCMLNYKADGSPFLNQIFVAALRDSSNKIVNYVGVQVEIKQKTCSSPSSLVSAAAAAVSASGSKSSAKRRSTKTSTEAEASAGATSTRSSSRRSSGRLISTGLGTEV